MDFFPENTISDYIVHLPKELNLIGSWEVGLAEIVYVNSWYNIDTAPYWVFYSRGSVETLTTLLPGYYEYPQFVLRQLLQQMKHEFQIQNEIHIRNGDLRKPLDFLLDIRYNIHTQLSEIHIRHKTGAPVYENDEGDEKPDVILTFSEPLANILGFSSNSFKKTGIYVSDRVVNMDSVNAIYLYCDIIEHRTVGNSLAPLLAVVPVEGRAGATVAKRYEKLQYHTILNKNISDIHISLRDDQGKPIRFRKGKVIVTLHFQKQKLEQL